MTTATPTAVVPHPFKRPSTGDDRCLTCRQPLEQGPHSIDEVEPVPQQRGPATVAAGQAAVAMVPVRRIQFHPRNIRDGLGDLRELTASIRAHGVLQPLLLHRRGHLLQAVDGARRLAASSLAERTKVPAVIVDELRDDQVIDRALATGLHKADITPEERRSAIRSLMHEFGHTAAELAARHGVTEATIRRWARDPKPVAATQRPSRTVGVRKLRGLVDEWAAREQLSSDALELLEQLRLLLPAAEARGQ